MKKFLLIALLPLSAHAFFCPNNFKQIDIGDSIQTVTARCGKPAEDRSNISKKEPAQEWTYYSPAPTTNRNKADIGTFKTTVAFDADGKAVNISVNGIGTSRTMLCGESIQLGATRDQIEKICGKSTMVTKSEASDSDNTVSPNGLKPGETQINEYIYKSVPPVTLRFENGVLTEKK